MAHPTESESWKNDIKGVVIKKNDVADPVTFTMEDSTGSVVSNQGFAGIFPNDNLAVGFMFEWQKVLNTHGAGCYTIKANFTIAGITGGFTIGVFDLRQYSIATAKRTVRIRSKFNTFYQKERLDFTNSNFEDTVRFKGFFGKRQPKTEINNLIGKDRKIEKSTRENLNEYTLETAPLDICITRQLIDFHLLNEDQCFATDHNASNHDYLLLDKPVVIKTTPELKYRNHNRLANIKATFGDRDLQDKNYYRTT